MTDQEINEAVARKLGFVRKDCERLSTLHWHCSNDHCYADRMLPNYCHSIAAAWEIIESIITDGDKQMKETGCSSTPSFALRMGPVGVFHCDLGNSGEAGWYQPTAPMAICLAFLKVNHDR